MDMLSCLDFILTKEKRKIESAAARKPYNNRIRMRKDSGRTQPRLPETLFRITGKHVLHHKKGSMTWRNGLFRITRKPVWHSRKALTRRQKRHNTLKDKGLTKSLKKRVFAPDEPAACEQTLLAELTLCSSGCIMDECAEMRAHATAARHSLRSEPQTARQGYGIPHLYVFFRLLR